MTFGGQSVGFVTVTDSGEIGLGGIRSQSRVLVVVSGCRFRPAGSSEVDGRSDVASEVWKLTAPPVAAALIADSTGELVWDGTTTPVLPTDPNSRDWFRIDGAPQPKFDMDGSVHHVTVAVKRQAG